MKTEKTITKSIARGLLSSLLIVVAPILLVRRQCALAIILAALAVLSVCLTTPLQAGEDLLQQFKSLRNAYIRDFNALPPFPESASTSNKFATEDLDGPIRSSQMMAVRDMQESRFFAQYAGRVRSLLSRDTELAPYAEKTARIYIQASNLSKRTADLQSQMLPISRALKTMFPRVDRTNPNDINAWNNLVGQRNSLDSQAVVLSHQSTALLEQATANNDDIQNRLQKRQSRGQADGLANSDSTTSDHFGGRKANPKLVPAEKGTIGSTKPGEQLKAAALEAKNGNKSDFRKNFDEGGAKSDGSLVAAHTVSAGPLPIDLSHFSERAKKDPQIVASLNNLSKLESKRMQVDKELNQLTAQRNTAKDPGTMKELTRKVDQETKLKQANLVEITNTTQEIEKRHREIDY